MVDSSGKRQVPLYNIIWIETVNGSLVIDYAAQSSKTCIKLEKWTFAPAKGKASPSSAQAGEFAARVLEQAYGDAQIRKRAYVLINPHAGPGGALRKWSIEVKPLFDAARMELDVVTLKRGGEATNLAEQVDIDKYDTIVACSGDGTAHEIFNGLAKRPDAARALAKIAVSHIPCGSGNAMSCNLYGSNRPSFAALAIIKGITTSLDLVSITQGNSRFLSFLSQSLGIVAESDLGTEHLRWMGGSRFEVGVLMRIFRRRCYPCDVAVKVEVGDKSDIKAHYKRHTNDARAKQPSLDATTGQNGRMGLPQLKYGTVQDQLPEDWELVQYDKIGNFYCGNMAYMAPDANFFSAAMASDGCMDLVTVNGDLSPITATKLLYSVESGKFFDNTHVKYKKISAYRIIPKNQKDGFISIDGERIPFEPFQAEIHQGLGRVISKRGTFEAAGPRNWDKVTLADRMNA
ncbi:sphingosine kinase [Metarhizium album ARSEF 1941]|uniref:Sphingosine kinase n=1 Tax=Metarhizium album (strain ARSEF 1941) TaxID=1081103 RepID=A0A0B2WYE4_METAS|nr:sphingosine kinase [Metarhizium album ARSEF 1941]KHN98614.1 sphingosine kinase [Metarhizium album ARSEF 1941]